MFYYLKCMMHFSVHCWVTKRVLNTSAAGRFINFALRLIYMCIIYELSARFDEGVLIF